MLFKVAQHVIDCCACKVTIFSSHRQMYIGKSVIFRVLPIVLVYSLIVKIQILYQRIENDYLLQIRLAQNTNLVEQICVMISFLYQLEGGFLFYR